MSVTQLDGPLIVTGQQPAIGTTGYVGDYNQDTGPSLAWGKLGRLDPRFRTRLGGGNSLSTSPTALMFDPMDRVIDQVPHAIVTGSIVAAAAPAASTAMTLVSTTANGITVMTAAYVDLNNLSIGAAGNLAIDGLPGYVVFGQTGAVNSWDPTKCLSRCVSVTGTSIATGGTVTIRGYDLYGQAMSQTLTIATGTATVTTTKAFKFIASVTPSFTDTGTLSVQQADVFGFPILAQVFADVQIYWNNALITANTGFTAAVATTPSATTGDVRGTYAVQSASDGTKALQVFARPRIANISTIVGLFGPTQA